MPIQLVNVGYGNFINADKVISVVEADSAPVKRMVTEARKVGVLVDATLGHKTRSVLVMESGHLILSAKTPETVAGNCTSLTQETRRSQRTEAAAAAAGRGA